MRLLVSVKNSEEALLATAANADYIDLKNPNDGAMGALNLTLTAEIINKINDKSKISATVGENHATLDALLNDIRERANLGINIIKICVSDLFNAPNFWVEMSNLSNTDIKIVPVFFADVAIDFGLIVKFRKVGFYGAMLDTQLKADSLLELQSPETLIKFVNLCEAHGLVSGLAGSLKPQDIEIIAKVNPTFIGMRGGLCDKNARATNLCETKLHNAQNLLRKRNKTAAKPLN